ncbi:ATP-dependent helicase/nuclease subunit B [Sphingobium wenxiniae]|uniref:ATP-dependent helicase/nuclease subunit B n=1 Tax=Sphingobium wenxiniae (strain DSM 21828 / CGMCC 1.7748 / JZ-1) TaxID=595605 RepID=A0A562KQ04_SPHWJ|nr:double-strand break repair protein AddB [Sphingobium wenxiniae]MBB6190221.1 ATP-dependent helicase/nuclease subunit B [Sphingobium wenxiniae]TWH97464.1 ATP-dependent helicase/nuclease subunit B [Sphingobium wenxiniae]
MVERGRPALFNIPAHRSFSDALVAGLLARHGDDPVKLAQGMVLLPGNRAIRSISDAFVRKSGGGLLLPRLVALGDAELGEQVGGALDPLGEQDAIPPAVGPMQRQMILARLVQDVSPRPVDAGQALQLAGTLASVLDQMQVERLSVAALRDIQLSDALSAHWQRSLDLLTVLLDRWPQELKRLGCIDLAERRNRLFDRVAERWKESPPRHFVVAAGISTTAPAIAGLLRRIAAMPHGMVVFAGLDQNMDADAWEAIGPFDPDPVTGRIPAGHETHPQYGLKRLLDRMSATRDDVAQWRWGSEHDARAVRGRNISNAMLPPRLTTRWRDLKTADRSLAGVEALEVATPGEEAQAIAIALREALETAGKTAALVTPDRQLATRVSAHLKRWNIEADDSAGQPLSRLPPGTLLIAMAQAVAERFAPVTLLALLKHPLVMRGEDRLPWLERVRGLDLLLRGPRPQAGLLGIDLLLAPREGEDRQRDLRARIGAWWPQARSLLAPLEAAFAGAPDLSAQLAAIREQAGLLSREAVWAGHQGRAAAELFADMEDHAGDGPREADMRSLPILLDHMLGGVAVRPPQGGHPRIAILGLIEARLMQADIMILGGLNEGVWPGMPAPDPWLAPSIRKDLGLPGLESRIGLAAHDFASALGAPQVLITRARRGAGGPAVASRFWLRLKAMAGPQWKSADRYADFARDIDRPALFRPAARPRPVPPASVRPKLVPVTDVDRLKADPYAFYARRILRLARLDPVDADAGPAWRGTAVHEILQRWAEAATLDPADLEDRARAMFARPDVHPLLRALWQPRLIEAIRWIAAEVTKDKGEGRSILAVEREGRTEIAGITLTGKADRIDRMTDGTLAIVDYKTGKPPSARQVRAGFALQLGLLGLIAEHGGFPGIEGRAVAGCFEYWSLAKKGDAFGYRESPVDPLGKRDKIVTADFTAYVHDLFEQAAAGYLNGTMPFEAQVNPEVASYGDYDQLMRLEEWYGRDDG